MSVPDVPTPVPEENRPKVTPAQIIALLIAGVPTAAKLGAAFAIFTLTAVQQAALTEALTWASVVAAALFVSDAGLRAARNNAVAKVQVAQLAPPPAPAVGTNVINAADGSDFDKVGEPLEEALLDEEAYAIAREPLDEPAVRQPSQDDPPAA